MIHKNRGNRRKTDWAKAIRKQEIVHDQHDYWRYPSLGYYRKGKIHCSCPMCSAKTNDCINKSNGAVDGSGRNGTRLTGTHMRYGKKNWKISDRKKIDRYNQQLSDYILQAVL